MAQGCVCSARASRRAARRDTMKAVPGGSECPAGHGGPDAAVCAPLPHGSRDHDAAEAACEAQPRAGAHAAAAAHTHAGAARRTPHATPSAPSGGRPRPSAVRRQAGRQAGRQTGTHARRPAATLRAFALIAPAAAGWRCVHVHVHVCLPPQSRSTRQAPRPIGGAGTDTGRRDQHDGRHQLSSPQHAEDPEQHGGRPQLYSFTWAPALRMKSDLQWQI